MTVPAIEFRGLSKSYADVLALDGVDLSVAPGEVFGFLGPNGAGKTTAIRILFDLIRPTSGQAFVLGLDAQRDGVASRALMGYVPGDLRLYDKLSGRQIVDLFTSLRPDELNQAQLAELCRRLDIDLDLRLGTLSKGNKQKIGLLLALMHAPPVLVLDEPTSGLDPLVQEEVAMLVAEHAAAGNTVFFSSHVLSEVERMCHRVGFIRHGRLITVEEVGRLKGRSLHVLEVTFAVDVPDETWHIQGVRQLVKEGKSVRLEVRSNLDAVLDAIAAFPVVDLRTEQPSLEEIFMAYYHDDVPAAGEATP